MVLRQLINAKGKGHLYSVVQYLTDATHVICSSTQKINRASTKLRMRTDEVERYERLLCGETWKTMTKEAFLKEISKPRRDR